jgi:hypothetical protein
MINDQRRQILFRQMRTKTLKTIIAMAAFALAAQYSHAQPATPNTRPSNAQASLAMDRLQDALGKPHVKGGVWYDRATDTYNWIGPKFGRHMSEPAGQFPYEVGHYLE